MTFEQALARLNDVSDAVHAARLMHASRADTAAATLGLNWPTVNLDVQRLRYQKTIELPKLPDLSGVMLEGQPLPPEIQYGIASLSGRDLEFDRTLTRPVVTALWPLYTGGQISSVQEGARAMQRQAAAMAVNAENTEQVKLVSLYFGQLLADQVEEARCQYRDAMQRHLDDVVAMEREGVATRAQRLQIQAARDAAVRGCVDAGHTLQAARIALSELLRLDDTVPVSSPLFVITTPLDSRQSFIDRGLNDNAQIRGMAAASDAIAQTVRAEQARWKPTVYLFGQYNMKRRDEVLTQPDWVAGVGMKYDLFAETDRRHSVSAAKHAHEAALRALEETRTQIRSGIAAAYERLESARSQYLLLESDEALARENVRIQTLSFREGQNTPSEIIDAQTRLTAVLVERAAAAYSYDTTLAQLLDASGRLAEYVPLMQRADRLATLVTP